MTLDTDVREPRKSDFNWMKSLLIGSLALNLLFVGGIASAVWHHRHGPGRGLMSFARDLPDDRRKSFIDEVRSGRTTLRPLRDEVRSTWEQSNVLLGEEPFDKAKFKAALEKVVDAERRLRAQMYDVIADAAGNMTADERQAFQKWRERKHERRMHRFERHKDDD
jgi:uncharacterized membrane protein